ncbi:helix-turn-helix domain-containing protein [Streptomyces sp. YIM 98790]|uniref:helix-turn-helix domain-containing protein n=1 Tax=Streptomyces sp. YIM 98790 TaxID=2689077 RepID=UPI00140D2021|nr:helix-turn-helix domain-containing protein [Streptomyces sp. YIM 98790]
MSSPTEPAPGAEDFVLPQAAARYLKCGERWLRDGCNHRGFPHHRMGNRLVFSRQDLKEIAAMARRPARSSGSRRTAASRTVAA